MYAHEIFKSFHTQDWQKHLYSSIFTDYQKIFASVLQGINDAVKFHMGNQSEVVAAVPGKILFNEILPESHFPYSVCWFDYTSDKPPDSPLTRRYGVHGSVRSALLCAEVEDRLFAVNHFTALSSADSWTMDPVMSFVANRLLSEYETLSSKLPPGGENSYGTSVILMPHPQFENHYEDFAQELYYNARTDISTLCRFLKLLNCKNSIFTNVKPKNKPFRKTKKQAKREPGSFQFAYKLLRLDLGKGRGTISLPSIKGLWRNPLHSVRGHFSTYTPERRLFGRYIGTYWIPPHLRGSADVGVVKKEYELEKQT